MARPQVRYTYEDYRQLPDDGKRYEVHDGELVVSPSPTRRHQQLSKRMQFQLYKYVEVDHQLGEVYYAPLDVILADDNVLVPDLIFVSRARQESFSRRGLEGAPDLVVEILSPSTRARDQGQKRRIYARFGVRELWLVDPERDAIDLHELVDGELTLVATYGAGDALASRVRLDLGAVFAP